MIIGKSCIILLILTYCKSALASTVSRDDGNNQTQGGFYVGGFLGGLTKLGADMAVSPALKYKLAPIYSHDIYMQLYTGYKIKSVKSRFFLSVEYFFYLNPQLTRLHGALNTAGTTVLDVTLRSCMPICGMAARPGVDFLDNTLSAYLKTGFFTSILALDMKNAAGYDNAFIDAGAGHILTMLESAFVGTNSHASPQHPVMIHGGIVLGLGTEWYFRPNWSIRAEATAFIHYNVVLPMFTCGIGVQWYPFMPSRN